MLLRLLLLFTLVPTAELYLLVATATWIGLLETLALCVLTGVVGAHLARREGLAVLGQVQGELGAGRVPGGALLEGALVFGGGLLLLTPGMMTDVLGFSLVVPFTRRRIAASLAARFQGALARGEVVHFAIGPGGGRGGVHFGGGFPPGAAPGPSPEPEAGDEDPYDDPRLRRIVHPR